LRSRISPPSPRRIQEWFNIRSPTYAKFGDTYDQAYNRIRNWEEDAVRHPVDLVAWAAGLSGTEREQTSPSSAKLNSGKLDPVSRAQAAPTILAALATNEPMWQALRNASNRPFSHYKVPYDLENPMSTPLPHLTLIWRHCSRLGLKASAELASSRSEAALEDIRLILRLGDSLHDEPFLVSQAVRSRCLRQAAEVAWEGLSQNQWSTEQLQELQNRLQRYQLIRDVQRVLDADRALVVLQFEVLLQGQFQIPTWIDQSSATEFLALVRVGHAIPRGWWYRELTEYCRLHTMVWDSAFNSESGVVSPKRIQTGKQALQDDLSEPGIPLIWKHRAFSKWILQPDPQKLISFLQETHLKLAAAQCCIDQASVACALERYRLSRGQYPEQLDALHPEFLTKPLTDPLSGKAYRYRRDKSGSYLLYSIGWDEEDNQGTPGPSSLFDTQGDWVWSYPK
jgi:hypothetical protein